MSIKKHIFKQGAVLDVTKAGVNGVCLELTRRWVKAQLTDSWRAGETIYDWTDVSTGELAKVLKNQKDRGKLRDVAVEGLDNDVGAQRTLSRHAKFDGLRTREDVINHVLAVGGVYIYAATAMFGAGHAFSFDTRNLNDIRFFDPNQGEFIFSGESADNMRTWWSEFWDASEAESTGGGINYKKHFHWGVRQLIRYQVPAELNE